jgi:hypothetical protein
MVNIEVMINKWTTHRLAPSPRCPRPCHPRRVVGQRVDLSVLGLLDPCLAVRRRLTYGK